jgi:hypothetical protein
MSAIGSKQHPVTASRAGPQECHASVLLMTGLSRLLHFNPAVILSQCILAHNSCGGVCCMQEGW